MTLKLEYMGKMKELFMKIHYPHGDYEREYLINDSLAKEEEYLEYLKLQKDSSIQIDHSKIEVKDGRKTRIQVGEEKYQYSKEVEISADGF